MISFNFLFIKNWCCYMIKWKIRKPNFLNTGEYNYTIRYTLRIVTEYTILFLGGESTNFWDS